MINFANREPRQVSVPNGSVFPPWLDFLSTPPGVAPAYASPRVVSPVEKLSALESVPTNSAQGFVSGDDHRAAIVAAVRARLGITDTRNLSVEELEHYNRELADALGIKLAPRRLYDPTVSFWDAFGDEGKKIGEALNKTVTGVIPPWFWALVALALVTASLYFLAPLFRR